MINAVETQQDRIDLENSGNSNYQKELNKEFKKRGLRLNAIRKLFK